MTDKSREERFRLRYGELVFHKRRHLDLTQIELARCAGTSRITIANIETGKHFPSLATALRVADALDLDWKEIMDLHASRGKK